MDPEQMQALAQRDQLWASLRLLKPFIDELSAGQFDGTPQQRQIVQLLARIVTAELQFRAEHATETPPPAEE